MMDVYTNPTLIDNAWKEFRGRTDENFKYEALIGDRPPALDYRK